MTGHPTTDGRVRAIVGEITRQDVDVVDRDADLVEALGVDSLQGLQILAAVEKRLDVRIPDDQLIHMRSIGRIVAAVEAQRMEHAS